MKHKNMNAYREWLIEDNNWAFTLEHDFSFAQIRTEIIDQMDIWEGMDILEVGCADGKTLKVLNEKHGANTYGIEPVEKLANKVGKHSTAFHMTVEEFFKWDSKNPKLFDAIILADIIEHLLEPWTVVRELGKRLKKDGAIYASIPNFFNAGVIYNLFGYGSFAYHSYDIINKDHLRFFTLRDCLNLFGICGLKATYLGGVKLELPDGCLETIKPLGEIFGREDYYFDIYQFVFKATK